MTEIIIYPSGIKGKYNQKRTKLGMNPGYDYYGVQPITKKTNINNVCSNNDNVISWGELYPDLISLRKGYVNGVYTYKHLGNFANTITSINGSYEYPEPFSTTGWNNLNSIPNSAKVKKITVEYEWDQVRYFHSNNHMTYKGSGNYGTYSSSGGIFSAPTIKLTIGGKSYSVTGPNVNNRNYCQSKNTYSYSSGELRQCSVDLKLPSGYTISDLKKSTLLFTPSRNTNNDVARIVMRYIRLKVEYDDIPPTFQVSDLSIKPPAITNCKNNKSTVNLTIKSTNGITRQTKIELSGNGIENANITNIKKATNDTFVKENGKYIWTANTFSNNSDTLQFDVSYDITGFFDITATVIDNKDSQKSSVTKNIQVNSCKPEFIFEFLNKDLKIQDAPYVDGRYNFVDVEVKEVYFRVKLNKSQLFDHNENITIDFQDLELQKQWSYNNSDEVFDIFDITFDGKSIKDEISYRENSGKYTITGIQKYDSSKDIVLTFKAVMEVSGNYTVTAYYNNLSKTEWNQEKSYHITVKGTPLGKEYFKLRLEDGSDVKYNSLMFTEGDDLLEPLTYTYEDINKNISNMIITGETKRIPVNEIEYVQFKIDLNTDKDIELKNVLTYIDISSEEYNANDIIVGSGKGVTLLESVENKICIIDSISSKEENIIKIAVKSDIEIDDVILKIKPYNYDKYDDGLWTPCHIMFKNIPNIKMSIEGISDLMYDESIKDNPDSYFWLYYSIENKSNVDGHNVRFQLKEPSQFKKIEYKFTDETLEDGAPWFNDNNRIITFPYLNKYSKKYIIAVKYQATKRGIYDFIIHTLDDKSDLEDDQYENFYQHTLLVNIDSDVKITTTVSKTLPYVDELIDFHIHVKNLHKAQKNFTFDVYDIGSYDINHSKNDYYIEYVNCKTGHFTPMPDKNYSYPDSHVGNKIGTWTIDEIDINEECDLTISVRPQDIGTHVFKTIFTDSKNNNQDFYNNVKVLEKNKQLEFNVYHAISEDKDGNCNDCSKLIEICDDDFINLGDDIYYVFDVINNSRNPITNAINIYARIPDSFLENGILCSSRNYTISQSTNLINFTLPNLPGCKSDGSKVKFCIKLKPAEIGTYISNFTLSTKNSSVLHKQLKLTVDTEFNERKLEHEINIYNFEKTNRYYRYEVDNANTIFKFFNTGDKTLRPIRSEGYKEGAVETYKGTNLRKIVNDIKRNSKYVEPVLLREGTNKLADKGYEMYPDGFIRRFGLLNSEVYHYSGQLPSTTDLVDKAMKWDVDRWNTKVWAGDIYDNGVFDLTIDYAKVPTNFNILEVENPIKNLQVLVDNVKPYGTKAICYYSASVDVSIAINVDTVKSEFNHNVDVHLYMPEDFSIISSYNRHDNTLAIYYDLMKINLEMELDTIIGNVKCINKDENVVSTDIQQVESSIYADAINKKYAKDCYNLISNAYNGTELEQNIDIIKDITDTLNDSTNSEIVNSPSKLSNIQVINFVNNLSDKQKVGFKITQYRDEAIYTHDNTDDRNNLSDNNIECVFERNDIDDFYGFKLNVNDNLIQSRNIEKDIEDVTLEIQVCQQNDIQILHFWGAVNDKKLYHIGHVILSDFIEPNYEIINDTNTELINYSIDNENDDTIAFKISDKVKKIEKSFDYVEGIEGKYKWQYLKHINDKNGKYAYFENSINIDPECATKPVNIPKIAFKYNNIDIDKTDEIVDIKFKIEAQSNKKDFEKDININLFKDGDDYLPEENIAKKIYYPSNITNVNQKFLTTINVEQNNMTICSKCLKTSLGYYDHCPYCNSDAVRHYAEKTPATACYNCDWITNGWHDYCPHCLSYNIEKIQIDFNKTYCNNCGTLSPDYYEHCPHCFSKDVVHLTNNTTRYQIFGEDKQNIDPITICADEERVNIFNLEIPLNFKTDELKKLEYLNLHVHGHNNNDGKYYYCEACESGGLGNYKECPECGSKLIKNYEINNNVVEVYLYANGNYYSPTTYPLTSNFDISLNLQEYSQKNKSDTFKLLFYIENQSYDKIINDILNLPIDDEDKDEILSVLPLFNITVDNLYFDYKYKDEREWVDLDKLQGNNHTYISYNVPNNATKTDAISFDDFGIERGEYLSGEFYIYGIIKGKYLPTLNIKIDNDGIIEKERYIIRDNLFNYSFDITEKVGKILDNVSIEVSFEGMLSNSEIYIMDCNILTEKKQYKHELNADINKISTKITKENNYYLLESLDNNLWGLNDTAPFYLSGRQLETNLIGYIDFGTLDLEEYLRIYNIDMIIYYKSKVGQIVTETISSTDNNKTKEAILYAAEKNNKTVTIDENTSEQILLGNIDRQNGEIWGSINYPVASLNNLEYEVTNINEENDLVNDIPLYYKLLQSFTTTSSSISKIYLNYYGKKGYPNSIITVYLCEDYNDNPGNIVASTKVQTPNVSEILNVDINAFDLDSNKKYWIVIEDPSANKFNYHRFKYNNNLNVGTLISNDGKVSVTNNNSVLSFGVDSIGSEEIFYTLPTTWHFYNEEYDGYKIQNTLYRYNIQDGSNVSLSNLNVKTGYKFVD